MNELADVPKARSLRIADTAVNRHGQMVHIIKGDSLNQAMFPSQALALARGWTTPEAIAERNRLNGADLVNPWPVSLDA